jgi:hypothetical protein
MRGIVFFAVTAVAAYETKAAGLIGEANDLLASISIP